MQSGQKQLRCEFQKVLNGVIQHSKEVRTLRNDVLPNPPICHQTLHSQPYA
jgi:hypothetical protein